MLTTTPTRSRFKTDWSDGPEVTEAVRYTDEYGNVRAVEIPYEPLQGPGVYDPFATKEPYVGCRADGRPFLVTPAAQFTQRTTERMDWDATEPDVTTFSEWEPKTEHDLFAGYSQIGKEQFVCWYCDNQITYAEYAAAMPQTATDDDKQRAFCFEFLTHYDECRAEHKGLPIVKTWWQGRRLSVEGYASPSVLKSFRVKDTL